MTTVAAEPGPKTRAFVRFVLRHGALLWAMALLLGVPASLRTVHLYANLKSDLEELLPRDAPSVMAIDELRRRNPGLQYLGVLVDTGSSAALPIGERFLDALAARIRTYPPDLVREVRTGHEVEQNFIEKHAPLYVELQDLQEIRRRIEARRDYEVSHESGQALDDEPAPSVDTSDIEKKYTQRIASRGDHESQRLTSQSDHLTMLFVEVGGFSTGVEKARSLLGRVQRDVAALSGEKYASGLRVGYASDVAISVEEFDALQNDLSWSSVLVVLAVGAVILGYYKWWRAPVALFPPLLLATVYAFGLASLPPFNVTELNSNTAFLGSIIVGNGINFGILLLARYREERKRGLDVEEALVRGVFGARAGTMAAALAAGVAYASLVITEFRGFRQFGYIGGLGMLTSWLVAFVLMPPLLLWVDRAPPAVAAPRKAVSLMGYVMRLVEAAPKRIAGLALLITVLAGWKVSHFDSSWLEYDFSKLRRYDTWQNGEGYWGRRMDRLLGHYLTPTIVMFDSEPAAQKGAGAFADSVERGVLRRYVATVRTIDDVLPQHQEQKLAELAKIRKTLTPRVRAAIPAEKRARLDELLGDERLTAVSADDLPRTLLTGLRERDGSIGRQVLLYPKPSRELWQAQGMAAFTGNARRLADTGVGAPGRIAGSVPLSTDISESIRRDAPIASAASLIGVVLVVLLVLRARRAALYVVGSLLTAVLWQGALTMLLGVKVNFANFIAFPITFGIGADYAVNVVARYFSDGENDVRGAVVSTGAAVGLCSLTTIIGYSSLLLAKNRALFYFGGVAVIGEIACLSTAVVALPALLVWIRGRTAQGLSRS